VRNCHSNSTLTPIRSVYVYYVNRGGELILLLCGGDKSSQQRDIEAAKQLAREED